MEEQQSAPFLLLNLKRCECYYEYTVENLREIEL